MRPSRIAALAAVVLSLGLSSQASGGTNPFTHGVAARASSKAAMMWTRTEAPGAYLLTVSRFPDLRDPIEVPVVADPEHDNTIKKNVRGLIPNRRYFYRFSLGTQTSSRGTFKTAPRKDRPHELDMALSGDSDVLWTDHPEPQDRPFSVLDRIREERPDLFVYMGDTIYSDSETGAEHALTVEEKWAKYKGNRLPATRRVLRSVSTWTVWDDHEVINDFDGADLAESDPDLLAAGRQAFNDYWPIKENRYYRKVDWGSKIDLLFLDERTYRSGSADGENSPCRDEEGDLDLAPQMPQDARAQLGMGPVDPDCLEHIRDPDHTILGDKQRSWLKNRLQSNARWKLILNEVPISQLFVQPYDRWEGFEWERNNILKFIKKHNLKGVIFLTTDLHANIGGRVYKDITNEDSKPISYEMITGPIQTCTLDCEVDKLINASGGGEYLKNFLINRGLTDTDCINIDHYGYGMISAGDKAGRLKLGWRSHQAGVGGGGVPMPNCENPTVTLEPGSTTPVDN